MRQNGCQNCVLVKIGLCHVHGVATDYFINVQHRVDGRVHFRKQRRKCGSSFKIVPFISSFVDMKCMGGAPHLQEKAEIEV